MTHKKPSLKEHRKERGGRFPATTTAALLDRSLPPIREDRIPGPIPRTRHQDAGRRIHHLAPPQRQPQSCWSRSLLVSRSRERSGWETRPSPPVIQSWKSRMFLPATTTAALLDGSLPPIREDQILGPTPRARHQDAGRHIHHHRVESSLATTTAKLTEQVPSHQSRERSASGSRPTPPVVKPRKNDPPSRIELPNLPREDQGPPPPAGPHAFTCSRPGVTFPSPPYNRNST